MQKDRALSVGLVSSNYQLQKIQHVMAGIRGCIDTIWDATHNGDDFEQKRPLISSIDKLREAAKEIEQHAFQLNEGERV